MAIILRLIGLALIIFMSPSCLGQTKLNSEFHLNYKNKTKTIRSNKEIRVFSYWHKNSDTLEVEIHPQSDSAFIVSKDTFAVRPAALFLQRYIARSSTDNTSPFYRLNTAYVIKLPISDIYKIKVSREGIQWSTFIVGYLALTSAVIVAPIVSIDKKFNFDRYKKVAGYSLLTAATALTINLSFGYKKYYLKKHKNKKIWTLS